MQPTGSSPPEGHAKRTGGEDARKVLFGEHSPEEPAAACANITCRLNDPACCLFSNSPRFCTRLEGENCVLVLCRKPSARMGARVLYVSARGELDELVAFPANGCAHRYTLEGLSGLFAETAASTGTGDELLKRCCVDGEVFSRRSEIIGPEVTGFAVSVFSRRVAAEKGSALRAIKYTWFGACSCLGCACGGLATAK